MFETTHAHILTWVLGAILFFAAYILKPGTKGQKVSHMVLRVLYILIIATGGYLFYRANGVDPMLYGLKLLAGILVIGFMEMTLVRKKKGKNAAALFILFAIAFLATLYLGFRLPLGLHFLAPDGAAG